MALCAAFLIRDDDETITSFRSRYPLSGGDTEWSDSDDESGSEAEDSSDDLFNDEERSDDGSSPDSGEESDREERSAIDSADASDDDIDFDCVADVTDATSPPLVAFPPDLQDLYQLLVYINELLKRIRLMVKFIRKSSLIDAYVREKMASVDGAKDLVCDLRIRWNSTWLMLDRFIMHRDVINSIISSPDRISGLVKKQKSKLRSFVMSHDDWEMAVCIHHILHPFLIATKILSGRNYPTLGAAFYVARKLETFLSANDDDSPVVLMIKESLRFHFKLHFQGNAPHRQKEYLLVSLMC
jgi:hypothetical protein